MLRNKKEYEQKKLRKLAEEYHSSFKKRRESGEWVSVEPYQQGWVRYFSLRDDIKNRKDARYIQQALNLVNTEVYSHREDFKRKDYKTGKYVPIEQKLNYLLEKDYENLSPNLQKLFVKREVRMKYSPKTFFAYFFIHEWYFVFKKEPNIITQRWLPDEEFESHIAEMQNKIYRDNLYPKINKAYSRPTSYKAKGWKIPMDVKNKRGVFLNDDMYDVDIDNGYEEIAEESYVE
jgi:hypothetical protein